MKYQTQKQEHTSKRHVIAQIWAVACFAVGVTCTHAHAQDYLNSAFDVAKARTTWEKKLKGDKEDFTCPKVEKPVVQFDGVSRYCDDDKTRSIVCPEKEQKYEDASENIDHFNTRMVELANRYVKAKLPRAEVAQCVVSSLAQWAAQGAWAPGVAQESQIGEYKRGVSLGAMSAAYQLVQHEPSLDAQKKRAVEEWLVALAQPLMHYVDDGEKTKRKSAFANHRYWEGLAVAQAGIATQRQDLFNWGIKAYDVGMQQVQDNGVLPLEMARAKKAFGYHLFALQPLVMLFEVMRANGIQPDPARLHLLVQMISPMIPEEDNSNDLFVYKDPYSTLKNNQLAWLEPYYARFAHDMNNANADIQAALIKDRREAENGSLRTSMAGGDMTFFFGAAQ